MQFFIDTANLDQIKEAQALGILDEVGTLEPGKMADVVIWDQDPFSVYAKTEKVFICLIKEFHLHTT